MLLGTSCAPYTPYTVNQSLIAYNNMSPSPIPYTIADAFTNKPFSGNPAAVIVLRNGLQLADSTSRLIARELNLSETAFVTPKPGDDDAAGSASLTFGLRWFTPRVEVALCGHATLAAAHVLFADPDLVPPAVAELRFETRKAGVLVVRRAPTGVGYQMHFPAGTTAKVDDAVLAGQIAHVLKRALGPAHAAAYIGAVQEHAFAGYLLIDLDGPVDLGKIEVNPSAFVRCLSEPVLSSGADAKWHIIYLTVLYSWTSHRSTRS